MMTASEIFRSICLNSGFWAAVFLGLVVYYAIFYLTTFRQYPKGTIPLPLSLELIYRYSRTPQLSRLLASLQQKYGNLFTSWGCGKPYIIVSDWDLMKEALVSKRNHFLGRPQNITARMMNAGYANLVFMDYGPEWEVLRKLVHSAIRKYVMSEKLANLVPELVDEAVDRMLEEKMPFDPLEHARLIVSNILAGIAFGKKFHASDPDFIVIKNAPEVIYWELRNGLPSDFFPALRLFFLHREWKVKKAYREFLDVIQKQYTEHCKTYEDGKIRNFTDAVICAREEAEQEEKDCLKYLSIGNLVLVLAVLFGGGVDTTLTALRWILLLLGNSPEIQDKIEKELRTSIGDRCVVQTDKASCPYTFAVVMETLRFASVIGLSLEHVSLLHTELGGHKLPKGTSVVFNLYSIHQNKEHWGDPENFRPERFLDSEGQLLSHQLTHYVPFGLGRRQCPGEKLAYVNLFLMLARLIQRCKVFLSTGPGTANTDPKPISVVTMPRDYKVFLEKR
ncbi:steroid 17-alpha-hydroxylase/17,20 lyase-like isoform X1 [Limulus polyphemus]|uniref:Steroid 17-alpha-hydroxylase/17,20 lyase-like isoform X1 n=1 Tax=Limulus polyphemus TaxID=6850 RepID=A0ABM1BHU2_LIMPO|nr:steroid 17-alpha-hydroxylase/17,20 lyase-like isoform X1 [Limulus polyphemus]